MIKCFVAILIFSLLINAQSSEPVKAPPMIRVNPATVEKPHTNPSPSSNQIKNDSNKENKIAQSISISASKIDTAIGSINCYEKTNKKDSKSKTDFWLAVFTGLLVAVGLMQFVTFLWQGIQLRKSVIVTEKTIQHQIVSERPNIFIKVQGRIDAMNNQCEYKEIAHNHGKTAAIFISFGVICDFVPIDIDIFKSEIIKGSVVIGPGENREFKYMKVLKSEEITNINAVKNKLFCYGIVGYEDVFKISYYTNFCWEYKIDGNWRSFCPSDNKEMNKYT